MTIWPHTLKLLRGLSYYILSHLSMGTGTVVMAQAIGPSGRSVRPLKTRRIDVGVNEIEL